MITLSINSNVVAIAASLGIPRRTVELAALWFEPLGSADPASRNTVYGLSVKARSRMRSCGCEEGLIECLKEIALLVSPTKEITHVIDWQNPLGMACPTYWEIAAGFNDERSGRCDH